MENKEMKKHNSLFIIGLISLIIVVGGLTFAFFNYEFAGNDASYVKLGNIEFSSNYSQVILSNIFPISSSDVATSSRVETVTVTITGRTEYEDGIEYLVSFTDVHNTLSSKVVPVSINVTTSGLGNSDSSYFTNRGGATAINKVLLEGKLLNEERIIIGYIPTGTSYVNGTITIKAYIDEDDVVVSDTYNEYGLENDDYATTNGVVNSRVVLTTSEWHSLKTEPISFKVRVEAQSGIWVNEPQDFYDLIEGKATTAPSYVKGYTATVINNNNATFTTQDTVETNNNKQEVYYYTGSDAITNGNVLFAGFCWQIVRTTDNGGIRLLYNGVAESNKCMDSRSDNTYRGVVAASENIPLASSYLYGESYDYDLTTGKFHLVNPESSTRTWTKATYESFMGKYTCKNATGENCDNIWYIGEYMWNSDSSAETTKYSIDSLDNYREIGKSSFNAGYSSPSNVGYMYNKIYNVKQVSALTEGVVYGKDVVYNNGNYLVIETNQETASTNTTFDEYHHYTCGTLDTNNNNTPITTCNVVRYYYVTEEGYYYYIELSNGEEVEDALKKMINYKQSGDTEDENINVYSSSMKDYLEIWYDKNLKAYEGYLDERAVYCNNRTVISLGGWNKVDGTYASNWLKFKQYNANLDLACNNATDRFSKGNDKARIRNPIGLITEPERGLMGGTYAATGSIYWGLSPCFFARPDANFRVVAAAGTTTNKAVYSVRMVRAAITLAPDTVILGGTGLKDDPYQVGPLVTRSN